jgi:hypothetical protein
MDRSEPPNAAAEPLHTVTSPGRASFRRFCARRLGSLDLDSAEPGATALVAPDPL